MIDTFSKNTTLSLFRPQDFTVPESISQPFRVGTVWQAEEIQNKILSWFEIVDLTHVSSIRELFRQARNFDAYCAGVQAVYNITFTNLSLKSSIVAWLGASGSVVINPFEHSYSYMFYQNPFTLGDSAKLDRAFGIFVKTYFGFLKNWASSGWLLHPYQAVTRRSLHRIAQQLSLANDVFSIEIAHSLCLQRQ